MEVCGQPSPNWYLCRTSSLSPWVSASVCFARAFWRCRISCSQRDKAPRHRQKNTTLGIGTTISSKKPQCAMIRCSTLQHYRLKTHTGTWYCRLYAVLSCCCGACLIEKLSKRDKTRRCVRSSIVDTPLRFASGTSRTCASRQCLPLQQQFGVGNSSATLTLVREPYPSDHEHVKCTETYPSGAQARARLEASQKKKNNPNSRLVPTSRKPRK